MPPTISGPVFFYWQQFGAKIKAYRDLPSITRSHPWIAELTDIELRMHR